MTGSEFVKVLIMHHYKYPSREGGFTLIELLVVLFILTATAFVALPNLWHNLANDNDTVIASHLKSLREEAISTKKETFLTVNFKERFFKIKGVRKEKVVDMKEGEVWEVLLPSSGLVKEGQLIIGFSPSVTEEFLALYLKKDGKDYTVVLNNISGEVEIEEGRRNFSE